MTIEHSRDEINDEFPVGMRVLAVDDDPICLRLLDTLLRKCLYNVTTTNQASTALKMLRENKNKFDLVISDVHMPDMDGFKLLELVGLEMDLPVIMLSANGDTKMVMKGISHGACDYLVKPVRLEELKNIWQHVMRKKWDTNNSNSLDRNGSDGNGNRSANSDRDAKLTRKRKDQSVDDDDEDQDENEDENEDPSQKKPRVVWSVDLHHKFVAAVNQIGLDKAVPKKILELMNDDKLSRENVASHLQKYRMYLKRISSVTNQQANMVTAIGPLGGPDYLRMNSVHFHGFNGSQFPYNSLRSISPPGVIGRLNTPAGFGLHRILPPGLVPSGQPQISTSSITDSTKFHPNLLPDHTGAALNGSSNSILNLPNSSLIMQGRSSQNRQSLQDFGVASNLSPNLLDHNRCNGNWAATVQSQPTQMNPLDKFPMQNPNIMQEGMMQNMIYPSKQVWNPNFLDSLVNSSMGSTQNAYASSNPSETLHRNTGFAPLAQPKFDSLCPQYDQIQQNNSGVDMATKTKQGQFTEQGGRHLENFANNDAGSLEDVVAAMFKHEVDGMTSHTDV